MKSTRESHASLCLCASALKSRLPFSVSTAVRRAAAPVAAPLACALFTVALSAAALLSAPLAASAAVAAGTWTTGNTWDEYVKSENNLLKLKYLVQNGEHPDFLICEEFNSAWTKREKWGDAAHAVTLRFPGKATITGLNFYSQWGDNGRVKIAINSVKVRSSSDGEWTTLENSGITYLGTNTSTSPQRRFALFAAADGSPLAEDVVEMQLDFPQQQNNGVGYVGMEVVGTVAEEPGLEPESECIWDGGGYDPDDWQALDASSNMMAYCSGILKDGKVTTDYDGMIDGKLEKTKAEPKYLVYPGQKVTWLFGKAITLQSFKVYSWWGDGGDGVGIFHLDTLDGDGVWTPRVLPKDYVLVGTDFGFESHEGQPNSNCATLRRKDGEPIATDIRGIRVLAHFEQSACWAEVEAEGWTDTSPAVLDERSITVTNDCWDVTWTAKLSSLGASDSATLNVWASLDNEVFELAASANVADTNTVVELKHTFDDVNRTVYYRFETVNGKDGREWRSTNDVASVVNRDNATYYWKPSVTSGQWDDAANWTNSREDGRLKWPTDKYTTADFSRLAEGSSVTVSVGTAHEPCLATAPLGASLTFTGAANVVLTASALVNGVTGLLVIDGLGFRVGGGAAEFADGARLVGRNGAALDISIYHLNGAKSSMELLSGATLKGNGSHSQVSGDSEIVLNGGSVTEAGYFTWTGTGTPNVGRLTFGLGGGTFTAKSSHCMEYGGEFTIRYVLPGGKWTGYETAPLRPKAVASGDYHRFGNVKNGNGAFRVELVAGDGLLRAESDFPLIETIPSADCSLINTNYFEFVAFGREMRAGVPNGTGDCFYWTYDGTGAKEPATAGTLPTGLWFHHAERGGSLLIVR